MSPAETEQRSALERVRVNLGRDLLSATVTLAEPGENAPECSREDILQALEQAEVSYGIDHDAIEALLAEPSFGNAIEIAHGLPAKRGTDAEFEFFFEKVPEIKPKVDTDGRIDYRDMNFVQNVCKDKVLIRKTMPGEGEPGKNIKGETIPAIPGRDLRFKVGENTHLSEDELELIASTDGAIVYRSGTVSVKEVMTISGSIDYKIGNINCVGSIRIAGDVHAGFEVIAGGNVEIGGDVETCKIEAGGDVLIKGGCRGSGEGWIKAGGNVIVKFAEGQHIEAGGCVVSGGELINCEVTAKDSVVIKGRHGKIIGGTINAGTQIRASFAGSDAGTPTVLAVAYDEVVMKQYRETIDELQRLESDKERVKESLVSLYRLQIDNKLTPEQEKVLAKLEQFKKDLPAELEKLNEVKLSLEEKMSELRHASIIIDEVIYPGVKAYFGIIYREIEEVIAKRKLVYDGSQIFLAEWEAE